VWTTQESEAPDTCFGSGHPASDTAQCEHTAGGRCCPLEPPPPFTLKVYNELAPPTLAPLETELAPLAPPPTRAQVLVATDVAARGLDVKSLCQARACPALPMPAAHPGPRRQPDASMLGLGTGSVPLSSGGGRSPISWVAQAVTLIQRLISGL
jgi:hypothetical protein